MKIIVIGKNGQVSRHLRHVLGDKATFLSHADLDLSVVSSIYPTLVKRLADEQAGVIINAGAYTDTKRAETEQGLAYAINAAAVGEIARAAKATETLLVHISTDYVFDGNQVTPYDETDATHPVSVYGASKRLGEQLIQSIAPKYWIIRTSWLFSEYRDNFVKTITQLVQTKPQLDIVADQRGCPTYAGHLAKIISEMLTRYEQKFNGHDVPDDKKSQLTSAIYHYADANACSWFDFAQVIVQVLAEEKQKSPDSPNGDASTALATLQAINSSDWPSPIRRPQNGVLNCNKICRDWGVQRFHWHDSLPHVLAQLNSQHAGQH